MNFNTFQQGCKRTANPSLFLNEALTNWALGVCGEAGEVAELIKKHIFHGKELDLNDVAKEIGDVLYYLAALCNTLGLQLEDCADGNFQKLMERYPDGFVEHKFRKDLQ